MSKQNTQHSSWCLSSLAKSQFGWPNHWPEVPSTHNIEKTLLPSAADTRNMIHKFGSVIQSDINKQTNKNKQTKTNKNKQKQSNKKQPNKKQINKLKSQTNKNKLVNKQVNKQTKTNTNKQISNKHK